jgi:hypothetical protein
MDLFCTVLLALMGDTATDTFYRAVEVEPIILRIYNFG